MAFEVFKIWYALDLANNEFADQTDALRKIENTTTPSGEEISLIYCLPNPFSKRVTDVSEALAVDPKSPDTGTAMANVIIRFTQQRKNGQPASPILDKLIEMFYLKGTDDIFLNGRFGLENSDNPKLDCLPIATAGYKLLTFKEEPNQNTLTITTWELHLKFLGDHTKLGTRTP